MTQKKAPAKPKAPASGAELVAATIKTEPAEKKSDAVLFVTKDRETAVGIRAGGKEYIPYHYDGVWVWSVDRDNAENFEKHSLVRFGRVARALER